MITEYFNKAAFVRNQPGRYGNAGRNLLSGPGAIDHRSVVDQDFLISERLGANSVPTEFFNAGTR